MIQQKVLNVVETYYDKNVFIIGGELDPSYSWNSRHETFPAIENYLALSELICRESNIIKKRKIKEPVVLHMLSEIDYNTINYTPLDPNACVLLPPITYFLRRMIYEKSKEKMQGFSPIILMKDLLELIDSLPLNFNMLRKETSELKHKILKYSGFEESLYFIATGDITYTKQFVAHYLLESGSMHADLYTEHTPTATEIKISTLFNYTPFLRLIERLVKKQLVTPTHIISDESPYLYDSTTGELLECIPEETYFYKNDQDKFNRLPESFLVEGMRINKYTDAPITGLNDILHAGSTELILGEYQHDMTMLQNGFALTKRRIWNIDMQYILDNYSFAVTNVTYLKFMTSKLGKQECLKHILNNYPWLVAEWELQSELLNVMDGAPTHNLVMRLDEHYSSKENFKSLYDLVQAEPFGEDLRK